MGKSSIINIAPVGCCKDNKYFSNLKDKVPPELCDHSGDRYCQAKEGCEWAPLIAAGKQPADK